MDEIDTSVDASTIPHGSENGGRGDRNVTCAICLEAIVLEELIKPTYFFVIELNQTFFFF
ncbi:hypothetical protein QJS04_geneDACA019958 [Acorus gramineus]|uniref:Uncharacterized protein n=1 Tax=Acorus gramineus TaxID=55184 RepID=A0AAV9B239_ACOGR|nr:hypothetical protein QJS04_geneDACA019958 [Acorus gramineus]